MDFKERVLIRCKIGERIFVLCILLIITASGFIVGCDANHMEGEGGVVEIDQISASEWETLKQRHVVFGHQSVGNNILSGVHSLTEKAGVQLQVMKSGNTKGGAGITHFEIGKNENPRSKMKDFEDAFNGETLQKADIALMKLCYVDINNGTDAKKLADEYMATLDRLSGRFPHTTFVAVTSPLTTLQSGPKAWIKKILGRTPSGYVENHRRLEFNEILRNTYGRQGRLFDLAGFEAAGAGSYTFQGHQVEKMNQAITSDGGHLNPTGERYIAAKLIKYLAALP